MEKHIQGPSSSEDAQHSLLETRKSTSMSTLILWNVTKALERKPVIDLKSAIEAVQERLESNPLGATTAASSQCPVERHLACALLAWQRLGHNNAESLHQFIQINRNQENLTKDALENSAKTSYIESLLSCENKKSKDLSTVAMNKKCPAGPVVKLPVDTVVMRLDNSSSRPPTGARQPPKKIKVPDRDLMTKIDAACCLDTDCVERLSELDTNTKEMRVRAARLAKREAERVELLERAEAAWRDLENGYQRRLTLALEKEEDMQKQIQNMVEERNGYKEACINLAQQLKTKGEAAEKDRKQLSLVEKDVCDRACMRLRMSEEAARGDATLAEHHCRAAQLERDLQFKEEQASRKLQTVEHDLESTRTLTLEAERAMRAELGAIRDQIRQISDQLISEDNDNGKIKNELEELRKEKLEMVEDLEGCKTTCDNRMQGKADELKKKRDQLEALKNKVLECRCKAPVDATIEVKRTPSLAALCQCTPEDRLEQSCSCTSLRTQLLSNMLGDLFGGLQAELGGCGTQMPCQLLKCLEDRHNWDRASIVKTNLRNFFSQLLIGELDIAIATAIEKYHAKWVGASCADEAKLTPEPGDDENEGWQERALERKAQQLAEKLAEQLFKERSEKLMQKAKDMVKTGPPPCQCKPIGSPSVSAAGSEKKSDKVAERSGEKDGERDGAKDGGKGSVTIAPMYWQRTQRDVTQLRIQIENLKKESLKKEDLRSMEEKLAKIVQRTSGPDKVKLSMSDSHNEECSKRELRNNKNSNYQDYKVYNIDSNKPINFNKKKPVDTNNTVRKLNRNTFNQSSAQERIGRSPRRPGQSYAVNVCLCSQKDPKKIVQQDIPLQNVIEPLGIKASPKQRSSKETSSHISNIKQSKPISMHVTTKPSYNMDMNKTSQTLSCANNCICFHKVPSNTSIDKLLETLAKWKCDLSDCLEKSDNIDVKGPVEKRSASEETKPTSLRDSHVSDLHSITENKSKLSDSKNGVNSNNNQTEKDVSKSISFEHNTPVSKESEYMGAINLDKSNENVCKCNMEGIGKHIKDAETGDSRYQFKCINSDACKCTENVDIKSSKLSEIQDNALRQNYNGLPVQSKFIENDIRAVESTKEKKERNVNENEVNIVNSEITSLVKKEILPCDCDYNIKFLGVTLADTKREKVVGDIANTKNNKDIKINRDFDGDSRDTSSNGDHIDLDLNKKPVNITIKTGDKPCKNTPTCACNIQFDEFKKLFNQNFRKPLSNKDMNQDKGLDVQSLKGVSEIQDCVCCDSHKGDESNDLELNAFYLLEEHLKKKLAEFKLSTCKSSCIPPDEEEKIYSAILQRVKKVITDSTNKLICKCPGGESLGSWNRAYGLLQEYLKIKIKRVQCLCVSSDNNKDEILPDVLDKVCNLIENDFHRLQSICTCNNDNLTEKNVRFKNKTTFEIPVKDTNNSEGKYDDNIRDFIDKTNESKISKQNSNTSMLVTQNISSQVPTNLGMENKSCDAIIKGTKDIQTSNKDLNLRSKGCDCVYSATVQKTEPFLELFGTNQVFINRCTDLTKSNDVTTIPIDIPDKSPENDCVVQKEEAHLLKQGDSSDLGKNTIPYIGYTVDCTCDQSLGICICTKSIVKANNDKIQSIWKTCTSDTCIHDAAYIMNGPNKYGNINNVFIPDDTVSIDKTVCETEVCTSIGEDLVLKSSPKNVHKTSITTNTFDDISIGTEFSNNDDPLDWYEHGSQMQKPGQSPVPENEDLRNSLYLPANLPSCRKRAKSDINLDKDSMRLPSSLSTNCDCDAVPICHVKMLVNNIENKLINSMCTCDSLVPKVCPVHSKLMG